MFRVRRPIEVVVLNCWVTDNERCVVRVQDFDDLREVDERAGEAVDLVDDDRINLPGLNICEESPECGTIQRGPRVPAVVVACSDWLPALALLTPDVGLAGFALSVERVGGRGAFLPLGRLSRVPHVA